MVITIGILSTIYTIRIKVCNDYLENFNETLMEETAFVQVSPGTLEAGLFKPDFVEIEHAGFGVNVFGRGPGDPAAYVGKVFAS